MTTTKNNEHKKLNFSSEREQSQACLNSAEHEKNQGRKVLNVPNKREQNQTCLDSAEREGLRPKGNVPNLRFRRRGISPWIAPRTRLTKYRETAEHEERQVTDPMHLSTQSLNL